MIGSVPVAVEMAFGVRPGTIPDPADWVDVTDYIDLTSSSSAILATAGRRTPRAGITPGTLSLTLENADGRFNPRNASGPYYGDLVNGVPVRVLVGVGDPDCGTVEVTFEGRKDATSWIPSVELVDASTTATVSFLGVQDGTPSGPADAPTTGWSDPTELGTSLPVDLYSFFEDGSADAVVVVSKYRIEFGDCTYDCFVWMDIGSTSDVDTVDVWVSGDGETWDSLTTSSSTTITVAPSPQTGTARWAGWVDSGWPQTITSRRPTVTITAHDILGLMSQGDAPTSAFDALLRTYTPQPDHWWRPGPTGWIDAVTGITMRHTGLLEQPSGQNTAIIVGEAAPWGQTEATGYGICEDDSVRLDSGATDITILTRIQLATIAERTVNGLAESVILIDQAEAVGYSPVRVTVSSGTIEVLAIDADGLRQSYTAEPNQAVRLMDGRPHTLLVHIPADSGDMYVWLDGRALQLTHDDTAGSYTLAPGDLYLGYAGPEVASKKAYQGYIDPLIIWRDHGGTYEQLEDLAVDAHEAATVGLANRRLDQRVSALVDAYGLTAHQGTLDTSGIVTQQSYRKDAALRLLQAIEDTEQGRVWVDHDGLLRFSARSWAWDDTVSNTVQIEFSDDPTLLDAGAHEMLEGGTAISDDPLNIVNVASVTSTFGRQQTVEDATSIAVYGRRNTLQLSGLLHGSDRQSRSIAEWLLLSQGDPQIQCRQLQFRVEDDPDVLAPIAAVIEEGWLVRIVKSTTAETLDMQAHVIGVSHDFRFTGWTVTLTLDATRTGYSFFKWGTSNWGGTAGWSF